ncbi:PucR family transcriptional regulator [Prauserella halophila]|uniref:PucR family transcriptional regulator n=1 Tax=Prauserella halophila TaxID=185641 RepID=A0ABN1WFH4_9PSEU|nr:PucR family transcriptional regulator [Prauserella halophila]MCP2238095.1 purine catabolism regulatory protein [Prauserella halophila]
MPTASDLTGHAQLGLTLRAGHAGADRPISWVHASELTDPTQFLSGGELLLTTGFALPETRDGQAAYIGRLAAAGLSGLGFGVQLGHDEIPEPLLAAAEASYLPVLEVPHRTPFIEISKTVSQALADTRSAEAHRFETARTALTTAAMRGEDLGGLIGRLATELTCWAVLLNPDGTVVHAEPTRAAEHTYALAPDLDRLRAVRPPSSIGSSADGEYVAAHSLGGGHRLAGFLVVGRDHTFTSTDHHITHAASSLLSIALTRARSAADPRLRAIALKLLLTGHRTAFDELADPLGMKLPGEPVVVLAGSGHSPTLVDSSATSDLLAADLDGELVAVASAAQQLPSARHLGVSPPTELDGLPGAYRQARQALTEATRHGAAVIRFDDLGVGLLHDVTDQGIGSRAEAMLRPLSAHDAQQRGELVRSLRAWIAHHGHWDPAAAELGVHRHTLRHRMSKVAALLDCNLDSPDVRAQLWLALRLVS